MYNYDTFTFCVPENCRGTGNKRFETEKNGRFGGQWKLCHLLRDQKAVFWYEYRLSLLHRFNNKNDYNILRHYIYTVTIDIAGANPLDLRVEIDMTSLSVVSDIGVNWGNDCIFPFMYSETL